MSTVSSDALAKLNFKYSDESSFNNDAAGITGSSDISVFHLNVRSLNKNSNDLYNFLTTLDLAFDVLVLSEIWNHNLELYSNLFAGYVFHYDCCATSHIGGIVT